VRHDSFGELCFSLHSGKDERRRWKIRPFAFVPGEVRKSFEAARSKLLFPSPKVLTALAGTRLPGVGFNLDSAWMVRRKEGFLAPDDEYVVQIYLVLPSRHGGSGSSITRRAK